VCGRCGNVAAGGTGGRCCRPVSERGRSGESLGQCLLGYGQESGLKSLRFEGGLPVNALTYITEEASKISLKYFIIFLVITISVIVLCFVGKYISILISHKTGKTTLDTIFDDYDSEGVVKQIQEREQQEETTSNEVQIDNTKESDQLAKDK
jgi:hypothetical protein